MGYGVSTSTPRKNLNLHKNLSPSIEQSLRWQRIVFRELRRLKLPDTHLRCAELAPPGRDLGRHLVRVKRGFISKTPFTQRLARQKFDVHNRDMLRDILRLFNCF